MDEKERRALISRLEVLEAQQAVMAGFVSVVMQTELHYLPEAARTQLRATYEALFERVIAQLLSSDIGFSDATIRAIEHLRENMLSAIPAS